MPPNDPQWGKKNNEGPPDLDEMLRKLQQKISGLLGLRSRPPGTPSGGGGGNMGAAGGGGRGFGIFLIGGGGRMRGFFLVHRGPPGGGPPPGQYPPPPTPRPRRGIPSPIERGGGVYVS